MRFRTCRLASAYSCWQQASNARSSLLMYELTAGELLGAGKEAPGQHWEGGCVTRPLPCRCRCSSSELSGRSLMIVDLLTI
jgi:hypothetical protein